MNPLDELSFPIQALIGVATVALMILVGRYVMMAASDVFVIWASTWGLGKVTDTDDSRRSMQIPARYTDIARTLYEAGFVPFGAMRRGFPRLRSALIYHVLRSPDDMVTVRFQEANADDIRVTFMTWFADDEVLLTEYPHGQAIEAPKLLSQFVRGSIAAAHEIHAAKVAEWAALGRTPRPVTEMADYVRLQGVLREKYRGLQANPAVAGYSLQLVPAVVGAAAAVGLIVGIYTLAPLTVAVFGTLLTISAFARSRLLIRTRNSIYHPIGAADDLPVRPAA